jgi:hypothetical protein
MVNLALYPTGSRATPGGGIKDWNSAKSGPLLQPDGEPGTLFPYSHRRPACPQVAESGLE